MDQIQTTRRGFLRVSAVGAAAVPYWIGSRQAKADEAKNDRPHVGCIGVGDRGTDDMQSAARFGEIVAVCDVQVEETCEKGDCHCRT